MEEGAALLVMEIAEVYQVRGVGTVVVGQVVCDEVRYRDTVRVVGTGTTLEATVGGVEQHGKVGGGRRGEHVGMLLVGGRLLGQLPVEAGMRVYLVEAAPPGDDAPALPSGGSRPWWRFWAEPDAAVDPPQSGRAAELSRSAAEVAPVSVDLIVYLRRSAMPSPSAWQRAIRATGLPVELDHDIDSDTFSGFLPCKLRGAASGFEYFAGRLSPAEVAEVSAPPGSDFSVTMVTHSDLREFACSVVAAGALAQASGGLLVDPQSGESFPAPDAMGWAARQFAEAERG